MENVYEVKEGCVVLNNKECRVKCEAQGVHAAPDLPIKKHASKFPAKDTTKSLNDLNDDDNFPASPSERSTILIDIYLHQSQ